MLSNSIFRHYSTFHDEECKGILNKLGVKIDEHTNAKILQHLIVQEEDNKKPKHVSRLSRCKLCKKTMIE